MKIKPMVLVLLLLGFSYLGGLIGVFVGHKQLKESRVQRDREERVGMDVLVPAFKLESLLVKKRSMLADGDSVSSLEPEIATLVAQVTKAHSSFESVLVTQADKTVMNGAWDTVSKAVANTESGTNEALIELSTYQNIIGDASDLIFDPELDSYYLMSGLVLALPKLCDQVGRVELAFQKHSAEKNIVNREALLGELAKLQVYEADLKSAVGTARNNVNQMKSEVKMSGVVTRLEKLEDTLFRFDKAAREGDSSLSSLRTEVLQASEALFVDMAGALNKLLEKRLARNA